VLLFFIMEKIEQQPSNNNEGEDKKNSVSRRKFLKVLGGAAAATALTGVGIKKLVDIREALDKKETENTHFGDGVIVNKNIEILPYPVQLGKNIQYFPSETYYVEIEVSGKTSKFILGKKGDFDSYSVGDILKVKYVQEKEAKDIHIKSIEKK
jgi:hypothetical protein